MLMSFPPSPKAMVSSSLMPKWRIIWSIPFCLVFPLAVTSTKADASGPSRSGDGGQDDCFFLGVDKGSQLEEGFVGMAVGIGLCFDGVHFELAVEDFLHYFAGLVHADVVLSHQDAWDVAFVAESCQGIHFRCRYGAFVDNGVFYKAIGAVHRDVAVYQIPFLQGRQVVDDDAWTSGRNEDMYAFGLGGSQRFNSGNGNFVGLEADQGSVDVKNRAFIIRVLLSCARNYLKAKIFRTFAHK